MCLKLKNKILQVIEIISNYGLIFAIYKFILFIIKNLFRRLIFDIKHDNSHLKFLGNQTKLQQ